MGNEIFQHEYDLAALSLIQPRGHDFRMYVTPRYLHHYTVEDYEPYTARFLANVLSRCSLFVDVGANYGFYGLLAATRHPALEVLALEPVPETAEAFRRSVQAAELSNIKVLELAVGNQDGEAEFHLSAAADSCGFSPHPAAPTLRKLRVKTTRLDTLLASRQPCATLIKVDVEGHELAVLHGLEQTLARFPDLALLLEFNPKMITAAGTDPAEFLRVLDQLGFAVFLLEEDPARPVRLPLGADWREYLGPLSYANLYCVRKQAALSVCFFSHSSLLAGAERSLLELVDELVADHGAVCSVVLPGAGPLSDALERAGAGCICADYGWWAASPPEPGGSAMAERLQWQLEEVILEVLPEITRLNPDVIWTQTIAIPWGAAVAALVKKPHVWSVCEYGELDHGFRFPGPLAELTEDILAASALVYTCSKDLGQTLFAAAAEGRWRALYRSISLPELPAQPQSSGWFQRAGARRLGMFATLQPSKGQEDAVGAVAQLVAEGRDVELLLAGPAEAGYRVHIEKLIAQHGLQEHVRVPGFLPDRISVMGEAEIVLVCSRREAFGRTALEAMLLGKPVAYAAAGGLAEFMVEGRTGLSYPPGDPAALAGVLRKLLDDAELLNRLGVEGRRYARGQFTRDAYGGEVYRTLRGLIGQPAGPGRLPRWLEPWVEPARARAAQRSRAPRRKSRQPAGAPPEPTEPQRISPLKKLERSFRKWRKRFGARHLISLKKRLAELRALLLRFAVDLRCTEATRRLAASRDCLRRSGLFDARWYFEQYPEARLGRPDPILHYLTRGAAAGFDPNPFFEGRWYLAQNGEAATCGWTPLEHYIRAGAAAGYDPSPQFRAAWYVSQYPEAQDSGINPLQHYLQRGRAAGHQPNPGFAPSSRYADTAVPFVPAVTVIVPNYNHAPYLRQRLDSIYGQTYRNFKVLLLDDASTDESAAILREYARKHPERTELLLNATNSGSVFAQWKRGLERARTELVWIAESDDFCEPNFLEVLVPHFRDEAVQIAYGLTRFVDEQGRSLDFTFDAYASAIDRRKWQSDYVESAHREVNSALGIRNTIPNVSAALLRHPGNLPLLEDPEWLKMRVCGDWVFYLHQARGGKIAFSRQAVASYRYHQANASRGTYQQLAYYQEHETVGRTVARLYQVPAAVFERQFEFLREHFAYAFRDTTPPAWKLEEVYSGERIRAEAARRLPNVLMVTYDFATGGGEIFAIRLGVGLRNRGYGVTFYDFNGAECNPEFRRLLPPQVPVVQYTPRGRSVGELIADFGIELVHTHHHGTDRLFAEQMAPDHGRPVQVVTMHGMYEALELGREAERLKQLTGRVRHWVYTAEKNTEPFKRHGLFDAARFTRSRTTMAWPTPVPVKRSTLGVPERAFLICVVSRAIAEKGWDEAIRAVESSRTQTGRDIHLLLVGTGPVYETLARQALAPYVHLLGFRPNPVDYYATADLGLLPTRYPSESCPLTVVECLMAGRPVIATDIGEIPNMLTGPDGQLAGWLLPLHDGNVSVPELSSAINRFATDDAFYRQAASVTAAAAKPFDLANVVEQYREIYGKALAGSHSGRAQPGEAAEGNK